MAPAIAHFLVGSSLLLAATLIAVLRYEFPVEHTLWALPLGGVWGIAPDFHHIAPRYNDALYAIHNSPWVEVFAVHYTLDQPVIRALYHESIFVVIGVFFIAIAAVWSAARYRTQVATVHSSFGRWLLAGGATLIAAGAATLVLGVALSVQSLLSTVAGVFGLATVFGGWRVVFVCGVGAAWLWTVGLEVGLADSQISRPAYGAGLGGLGGGGAWVVSAVAVLPWLTGHGSPVLHWGGLVGLLVYGTVFGLTYATLRGAFHPRSAP